MNRIKYVVYFEGIHIDKTIKGFYAAKQPNYKWSFTEDIKLAKRYTKRGAEVQEEIIYGIKNNE